MTKQLQPHGATDLGPVQLRTPGLRGTAQLLSRPAGPALLGAAAAEAPTGLPPRLAAALERSGVRQLHAVEVSNLRLDQPTLVAGPVTEPIQLMVRRPEPAAELAEETGMVALSTDPQGVLRWHLGEPPDDAGHVAFSVPATVDDGAGDGQALLGGLGRLLIHVLTFPIGQIAGRLASRVIRDWEGGKRPPRVRPVTPDNYTTGFAGQMTAGDWSRLAGGRALLWVHGTFSQTESGFGAMPRDTMAGLHAAYEGRMFGYDHPTVGFSPNENVDTLLAICRAGLRSLPVDALDLDIVCHSRGGLVSRLLTEQATAGQPLRVGKIVFVAAPNAGTQLCDTRYMGKLIDRYTNLLALVPNPVVDALETVIELVKTVAVATVDRLPGLHAMCPAAHGGEFLAELNKAPQVSVPYFALGSNYEPPAGIKAMIWGQDELMDEVFRRDTVHGLEPVGNDLVVPTASVWDLGNGASFPVVQRESWDPDRSVNHSGFFTDSASMDRLSTWLTQS